MVGEIRDSETAEIAIRAALTGHQVFSTLHTNDADGRRDAACWTWASRRSSFPRPGGRPRPAAGPADLPRLPRREHRLPRRCASVCRPWGPGDEGMTFIMGEAARNVAGPGIGAGSGSSNSCRSRPSCGSSSFGRVSRGVEDDCAADDDHDAPGRLEQGSGRPDHPGGDPPGVLGRPV